ncbi:hypothetical protein NHX12_015550 [Muraenolepis orangiensis]|uniref:Reverse transcriptase domain-containing protein n=1 Tax=Muraenolepis orangiensis TaxID=630683 RepID=A0A9Q0DC25_9TELE|nr:hypothetical protein NHX12_015550 [Muraenolepis orangiensis]
MVEALAQNTNEYSFQERGTSVNTTAKEIEKMLGMYLKMGLVQMAGTRMYWETETRYSPVADVMPRNRFQSLLTSLHFVNNMTVSETEKKDKLWKLRLWLDSFREKCLQVVPEEHNSVDEMMIPFKGKFSSIKQYMRGKPNPWGFKVWVRTGISGMMCDFDVYQGSVNGIRAKSELGLSGAASVDSNLSGEFTAEELSEAMSKLKPGKSPGRDNIHPEFVIHQSTTTSGWLCAFYTSCYQRLKLPKTWRRASVIALPKPNKPAEDPKSYRPISLLCVPFKILERMIHSRIEPVVDSQLPREQAGFRRGRSTADQVTLLCQDIEDSFQNNEKAGVVYLDLTAAYDTVWHRGLHLKLLRTIPDRHMVKFIMETLSNRSFILQTSSGQCSRLRRLKNGVPQGSVLSPMLFNVNIHDLPDTVSRKYGYADDLAIMLSRPTWKAMEEGLNEDMDTLVAYLRRWRLQLSVGKSVAAAYHLSTREARREFQVHVDNKCLEVQQAPKYLGVRLDRTLSFKQHLEEVKAKVTSRVALIRRLAGTTWGASAKTLRISTQALVFSAAEYCAPVWSRSPHARKSSRE